MARSGQLRGDYDYGQAGALVGQGNGGGADILFAISNGSLRTDGPARRITLRPRKPAACAAA